MEKAVFGIAKSESQAVSITSQLKTAGFSQNDISVLLPDKTGEPGTSLTGAHQGA